MAFSVSKRIFRILHIQKSNLLCSAPASYFLRTGSGILGSVAFICLRAPSFRGGPNTYIQANFPGQLFRVRPAVRIPCRHEAPRCGKSKDFARVGNVYENYVKMRTKFVPYLVRNSLHLRSVFSIKTLVFGYQTNQVSGLLGSISPPPP